ncbi:Sensor histidine kinase RcsC [compost metagenome]
MNIPISRSLRSLAWRSAGAALALAVSLLVLPVLAFAAGLPAADQHDALPRRLLVGVLVSGEPLEGVKDGRLVGFSADLLRQLFANSGTVLEARAYRRRDEMLQAACEGKLDLVMNAVPRGAFADCLVYSAPYLERASVLVARKDDVPAMQDGFSRGARVALEAGSAWAEELRERHPGVTVTEEASMALALEALNAGQADIYVGTGQKVQLALREQRFEGLRIVRRLDSETPAFRFAAPARNAGVLRELNSRLAQAPDDVVEALRDRWLRAGVATMALTQAERDALLRYPVIRYAVPFRLPPYAVEDAQGNLSGLLVDYLSSLGKSLGVEFRYVPTRDAMNAGERLSLGEIDLIAGPGQQPVGSTMLPAGTIDVAPMVIVIPANAPYASSLKDIAHRRVAVVRGDPMEEAIRARLPHADLIAVHSTSEALDMVNSGNADAVLGNLATMDALLRGRGLRDLRIAGLAGFDQEVGLRVASNLESLSQALERALSVMPELERERIHRKWTSSAYQFNVPWRAAVKRIWPMLALGALMMLVLAVSHFRLRQQVALRRRIEEHLENQLAFQEALLASLPEPVAARNANRCYVALNPAFERFFGVKRDDIIGHAVKAVDAEPAASVDALLALQEEAVAAMEPRHIQVELCNAAGQLRTVIFWVVPFRRRDGSPGGTVTTHMDITEVHEARQRAIAAERQLKDVTDSLPDVVFQSRRGPSDTWGKVVYAAGDGEGTLGCRAADLLGKVSPKQGLLMPDEWRRLGDAMEQAAAARAPLEFEVLLAGVQRPRWVQLRAVPRFEGGDLVWNGVISDVTERHHQASALRVAKEAAEAALRAKEGFLAMMSHEIRTPMNGVLGLVELLEKTQLNGDQRRMLALAKESGTALAQILDDILDYAKIEAGRLTITPAPLDLRELFDSIVNLMLPQAHSKGVQLRLVVSDAVPATVQVDGIRVRQILFNLVGNAIKFTDKGSVTLRADAQPVAHGMAMVSVSVEDTGIGIPKGDIQRLFAPFVQSERSTTRRFGGTGLGLSISRRLAEMMDGKVTLDSEEGVGTRALLQFPCSVLCGTYELPRLKGRLAVIDTGSMTVAESLAACASAAGMQLVSAAEAQGEAAREVVWFVDIGRAPSRHLAGNVILLTEVPKQTGFRAEGRQIRLSINPLRWTAFLAALEALQNVEGNVTVSGAAMMPVQDSHHVARRILVAEDHPINRELVRQQLQLLGYASVVTENGKEALHALEHGRFDLVLTDCHMPVMDGIELTRAIRSSGCEALRGLPVVGITATTVREEHERCLEAGMTAIVLKPTTLASLQAALADAVREPGVPDDDAAMPPAPGEPAAATLQPIDLCAAAQSLGAMLQSQPGQQALIQSLRADRSELLTCVAAGSIEDLRNWCHKVSGALSLLGQAAVNQVMDRFHQVVRQGSAWQAATAAGPVLAMFEHLIAGFEDLFDNPAVISTAP